MEDQNEHRMEVRGSKRVSRIEILDGATGRRRWPDDLKVRIVAESFQPGARVCDVAAKYGLIARHLSGWRGQARKGELVVPIDAAPAFVPLVPSLRCRCHSGGYAKRADRRRFADRGHARPCRGLQICRPLAALSPMPDLWPGRRGPGSVNPGKLVRCGGLSSGPVRRPDADPPQTVQPPVHGRDPSAGPRSQGR
jgi:transposase-like protein